MTIINTAMTIREIELKCSDKQKELLNKYFGNLVHEAAEECPESIGEYTLDLPKKIEAEYYDYLKELWAEINTDSSLCFEDIMDKRRLSEQITEDDREQLKYAYRAAQTRTLWEKLTKSNHEDVTYYKGLLQVYTEELLSWLRVDFIEDVRR